MFKMILIRPVIRAQFHMQSPPEAIYVPAERPDSQVRIR